MQANDEATSAASALLSLPSVLLREVLSWSVDSHSANALLTSCQASHSLRQDSAAAALLLLRRSAPSRDYATSLKTCGSSCQGGAGAVVQQLLQWHHASSTGRGDAGRAPPLPPPLVQAALYAASASGDAASIRLLLSLPAPPNPNGHDSAALRCALQPGGHVAALRALLEGGADPCRFLDGHLISVAARTPALIYALPLLLSHCPAASLANVTRRSLRAAAGVNNVPAVELLLPAAAADVAAAAGYTYLDGLMWSAAAAGHSAVLQLLLEHYQPDAFCLNHGLRQAVDDGHPECAALLLDRGADVDHCDNWCLKSVVNWEPAAQRWGGWRRLRPEEEEARLAMVHLLLRHGAAVVPEVLTAAHRAACPEVLLLLLQPPPTVPLQPIAPRQAA